MEKKKKKKKKKKEGRKFLRGPGARSPGKCWKLRQICAIWGILEANLKKSSTLMFMMNISFVPSICIHRSTIFIFIEINLNTFPDNCWKLNILPFSHCVCVCLRERESVCVLVRERERAVSFPRPAYQNTSVSTPNCVRIFRFMIGLFSLFYLVLCFVCVCFFLVCLCVWCVYVCVCARAWTTNQSRQKKKKSKDNFSIIYLLRTECEITFSRKQMHYKTSTLWHLDASILFMSANVILDERHASILFTSSKVLSASAKVFLDKRRTKFLQKQCAVCAAFPDADMSFLERLMSDQSLFPWSLAFFLLFLGSMRSRVATDRFVYKPTICEEG